jgi:hypothetical protein
MMYAVTTVSQQRIKVSPVGMRRRQRRNQPSSAAGMMSSVASGPMWWLSQ